MRAGVYNNTNFAAICFSAAISFHSFSSFSFIAHFVRFPSTMVNFMNVLSTSQKMPGKNSGTSFRRLFVVIINKFVFLKQISPFLLSFFN